MAYDTGASSQFGDFSNEFGHAAGPVPVTAGAGAGAVRRNVRQPGQASFAVPLSPYSVGNLVGGLRGLTEAGYTGEGGAGLRPTFKLGRGGAGYGGGGYGGGVGGYGGGGGGGGVRAPAGAAPMMTPLSVGGGPARDAGGLTPMQRANFTASLQANNQGQAAKERAFRDAKASGVDDAHARVAAADAEDDTQRDILATPMLGENYNLNRTLAGNEDARRTQTTTAQAGLTDSEAGVNDAAAADTRALTPVNVAAGKQAIEQRGRIFPHVLAGAALNEQQGQNAVERGRIENGFVAPTLQADIDATRAGVAGVKSLQQQNQQLQKRVSGYEGRFAKMIGDGEFDPSQAMTPMMPPMMTPMSVGGGAQQQVQNLHPAPTPGNPARTLPMTPNTPAGGAAPMVQGGGASFQVGQTIANKATGQRMRWNGSGWEPVAAAPAPANPYAAQGYASMAY